MPDVVAESVLDGAPDDAPLTLLYRDAHLVAIDKPAKLLVHRSEIDRHETRFAVQMLRDQIGQKVWPAHRLDRGTSGVLIFALNSEIAAQIGAQFAAGQVEKRYLAVVRGHPPESGSIDHPLSRQRDDYEFQGARSSHEAQPALTHFRRLATVELPVAIEPYPQSRYALLELTPVTGRKHQIRRHLKHLAHPIIGDSTYGKGQHNRYFAGELNCSRLLLACTALRLQHPVTQENLQLKAAPSGEFADLLKKFGWTAP